MTDEAQQAVTGFCYIQAVALAASGIASLIKGPRITGLLKLGAAGAFAWSGLKPESDRLTIATGASAAVAGMDLINSVRPGITGRQRLGRLGGALVNGAFAVLHNEASKDV